MTLRHIRLAPVIAALVLVLAACGGSGSPGESPSSAAATDTGEEQVHVGLVQIDLTHPFHVGEVEGAEEAARRNDFKLTVVGGEGDVTKQIAAFENLIQQGVDVISVNAIDIAAYGPALEAAAAANIPVVLLHSESDQVVATLGFDEYATGQAVGEYAITLLEEKNGSASGQVAILQGLLGQGLNESRTGGFTDVMDEYPDIEVVAKEPTNWDPQRATEITENLLVAHPDLDMIYGLSDGLTVPAAEAVERAGRADDIIMVSVDGSDFALEAVEEGRLASTFLYAPQYSGYWKAWLPYRVALGEDVDRENLIRGALVTPENVEPVTELVTDMQENIEEFPFETSLEDLFDQYVNR